MFKGEERMIKGMAMPKTISKSKRFYMFYTVKTTRLMRPLWLKDRNDI